MDVTSVKMAPDLSGQPGLKFKHLEMWFELASGGEKVDRQIVSPGSGISTSIFNPKLGPGDWMLKMAYWVEGADGNPFVFETRSEPIKHAA
ncbi:MAG: hypothetical protein FWD94_00610 [Treponema sp.]|nr:hypothetical protein [Treponema sp.]